MFKKVPKEVKMALSGEGVTSEDRDHLVKYLISALCCCCCVLQSLCVHLEKYLGLSYKSMFIKGWPKN